MASPPPSTALASAEQPGRNRARRQRTRHPFDVEFNTRVSNQLREFMDQHGSQFPESIKESVAGCLKYAKRAPSNLMRPSNHYIWKMTLGSREKDLDWGVWLVFRAIYYTPYKDSNVTKEREVAARLLTSKIARMIQERYGDGVDISNDNFPSSYPPRPQSWLPLRTSISAVQANNTTESSHTNAEPTGTHEQSTSSPAPEITAGTSDIDQDIEIKSPPSSTNSTEVDVTRPEEITVSSTIDRATRQERRNKDLQGATDISAELTRRLEALQASMARQEDEDEDSGVHKGQTGFTETQTQIMIQAELTRLRHAISSLHAGHEGLLLENEQLRAEHIELRDQMGKLGAQNQHLLKQNEQLREEFVELTDEWSDFRDSIMTG